MKILVPTDMSPAANRALRYGANLGKMLSAEIILLHIVQVETPPLAQVFGFIEKEMEDITIESANNELAQQAQALKSQNPNLAVTFKAILGTAANEKIVNFAIDENIDFICMGTKGASGIKKLLLGSNATAVINKSPIPVITVPTSYKDDKIERIIFASNLHNALSEIKPIVHLAKILKAEICILNIAKAESTTESVETETLLKNIIGTHGYDKISIKVIHNEHIIESMEEFVATSQGDLLAMHTHEMGFFEQCASHSLSREEAFHPAVPLITFKGFETI